MNTKKFTPSELSTIGHNQRIKRGYTNRDDERKVFVRKRKSNAGLPKGTVFARIFQRNTTKARLGGLSA